MFKILTALDKKGITFCDFVSGLHKFEDSLYRVAKTRFSNWASIEYAKYAGNLVKKYEPGYLQKFNLSEKQSDDALYVYSVDAKIRTICDRGFNAPAYQPPNTIYNSGITTPEDDEMHNNAFSIAKDFVKENLKAPSSVDFSSNYSWGKIGNDNTYLITSTLDGQNSFGAMLRSKWNVKLSYNGGEWMDKSNWTLLNITIE